ncbi:MAG: hypothetical protein QM622_04935 [Microbacterium sp.]
MPAEHGAPEYVPVLVPSCVRFVARSCALIRQKGGGWGSGVKVTRGGGVVGVVSAGGAVQVVVCGGSAEGGVDLVVEITFSRGHHAPREPAPLIDGFQEPLQLCRRTIPVHREHGTRDRMGEHAIPPRRRTHQPQCGGGVDRLASVEHSGLVTDPRERQHRDGDVHVPTDRAEGNAEVLVDSGTALI